MWPGFAMQSGDTPPLTLGPPLRKDTPTPTPTPVSPRGGREKRTEVAPCPAVLPSPISSPSRSSQGDRRWKQPASFFRSVTQTAAASAAPHGRLRPALPSQWGLRGSPGPKPPPRECRAVWTSSWAPHLGLSPSLGWPLPQDPSEEALTSCPLLAPAPTAGAGSPQGSQGWAV